MEWKVGRYRYVWSERDHIVVNQTNWNSREIYAAAALQWKFLWKTVAVALIYLILFARRPTIIIVNPRRRSWSSSCQKTTSWSHNLFRGKLFVMNRFLVPLSSQHACCCCFVFLEIVIFYVVFVTSFTGHRSASPQSLYTCFHATILNRYSASIKCILHQ